MKFWAGLRGVCTVILLSMAGASAAALKVVQMDHTAWTSRDAAPLGIYDMAQTGDGVLWIGAESGLYRFDGLHFSLFEPAPDEPRFPSIAVLRLAVARDGTLWVGFGSGGGLARLNGNRVLQVYGLADGLPSNQIDELLQAPTGSMEVVTGARAYRRQGEHWAQDASLNALQDELIRHVFYDRDGGTWVATATTLWHSHPGISEFHRVSDSGGWVDSMDEGTDGSVWVNSLIPLQPDNVLRRFALAEPHTNSTAAIRFSSSHVLFDDDGFLWAADQTQTNGLVRLDPAHLDTNRLFADRYGHADGLSGNGGGNFFKDRWGNMWMGTHGGLDRFRKPNLIRILDLEDNFSVLTACPSGEIWTATTDEPLRSIKDGVIVEHAAHAEPQAIYCDASNTVWYVDNLGFSRFDNGHRTVLTTPTGRNDPRQIVRDEAGGFFVSVLRAGLWRFNDNAWSKVSFPGFPADTPTALFTDTAGTLWTGYADGKIVSLRGAEVRTLAPAKPESIGVVQSFAESRFGLIAAGTVGVSLLRGDHFQPLLVSDPMTVRGVSGVVAALNGDLWLNGAHGIARIRGRELVQSAQNPAYLTRTELFAESGITGPATQLRTPTAVIDSSGHLWFATSNSIVTVDPEHLVDAVSLPILSVQSLSADGVPAVETSRIAHQHHTIRIKYQGIFLGQPEKVTYKTKLDGFDKDWQDVGNRSEAVYTGLRPGSYLFHVIASNDQSAWTQPGASIGFTLLPAFWQTAAFAAACVASAMLLLWILFRLRMRQLAAGIRTRAEERADERVRIARDLHDTLLQGIQGLMLRLHVAIEQLPPTLPARQLFDSIIGRADTIVVDARDRVSRLRVNTFATVHLAQNFLTIGADLNMGDEVAFKVEEHGTRIELYPHIAEELHFIGREAITNAFKHARAAKIEVAIRFEDGFALSVRDDGCGFQSAAAPPSTGGHWGLLGMKERAHRIDARFECQSAAGVGTEISVYLPARRAYIATPNRLRRWLTRNR